MTDEDPGAEAPASEPDWGVAWFGEHATLGTCLRCRRVGMVFQGYNGGARMGTFCADCQDPVLGGRPSTILVNRMPEMSEKEAQEAVNRLGADMLTAQRTAHLMPATWSTTSGNPWTNPMVPHPDRRWMRVQCHCGKSFWTLEGYRGHFALEHIIGRHRNAAEDVR